MQNRKAVVLIVGPATIYGKQMLTNSRIHCLRMPGCLSTFSYNTSGYMPSNSHSKALTSPTYIFLTTSTFKLIYQQTLFKDRQLLLMCRIKGRPSSENELYINSMITTVHRGGNLLDKGLASRTNPRKFKVNRTLRRTESFVLIFETYHCKLDIIVNDFLRKPVVNKYFFEYLEFIFNLAITADIQSSKGKISD